MKAEEFDKLFDDGEEITHLLDLSSTLFQHQYQSPVQAERGNLQDSVSA